MLILCQSI